jgi:hypothetical protein
MIDRFEGCIENQKFKLLEVIKGSRMYYIEEDEVRRLTNGMNVFTNLNYKSDLAVLEELFKGGRIDNG